MTTGLLLLHGSSGVPHLDRAAVFEALGVDVIAPTWFGPEGVREIALESFGVHLDALASRVDRVAVMGTSKGAEAALLLGTIDPRIDVVIAAAPTSHVWAGVGPGDAGRRSSWTWQSRPLPFVSYVDGWTPADPSYPSFTEVYVESLRACVDSEAAEIPAERFAGELILIAGGDDHVWPAADFARHLGVRRPSTRTVIGEDAGHRVILPGEKPSGLGANLDRGGTPEADRALGELAWPIIRTALHI
ncbi:hypothetical protein [Kribbella deserti]|uniref:Acyl-CoA thioesterase n=1 Tax=Kribbella deserti TaxID=1926257 RepID=A0ABV6QW12_9ACTN